MNKTLIIGGGILLLAVIVLGVYFFMRESRPEELIMQKNDLEDALDVAQKKLSKEKENLHTLAEGLKASFPLAVSLQEQMEKSSNIVRQTDFMFINPYGSKPELIVKNPLTGILINNERNNINLLLIEWQNKVDLLSVEKIDLNESEKIKKDVQKIKSFINNLSKIVKSLTPANSGLSQAQIDSYLSRLLFTGNIDRVLVSVETSIENFTNNNSQTNTIVNSQTTSSSEGSSVALTTTSDVIVQQSVVAQTQSQVAALQEKLAQVEVQIQKSVTTPTPVSTTSTTNTNSESHTENQNTNSENNINTVNTYAPREITPSRGIIIQPGPPRLIQGMDEY